MPETLCGFNDVPGGATGRDLLAAYGPTLMVDVGFDSNYKPGPPWSTPVPGLTGIDALVDTGAGESCIDSLLAAQLNLPIVDRRSISGVHGAQMVNMHLAQIHVPSLAFTIYGAFAAVELVAGGQIHKVLIGRTFLQNFSMVYEGLTGTVKLSR
jgi:predicted aspartyl protease